MGIKVAIVSSALQYFAVLGFMVFSAYIIIMVLWADRLYKLIIKTDPDFFGGDSKLFLAKYFAKSSMLSVIMSGQYRKIKDEHLIKQCDKCRVANLALFISFFLFVVFMIVVQSLIGQT